MNQFPHSLEVYLFTEQRVPGGGTEKTRSYFKSVSECFVTPISGRESIQAMQTTEQMDYRVYMPYEFASGITSNMEFEHDGIVLQLVGPGKDIGGQREIMMYQCKSVD